MIKLRLSRVGSVNHAYYRIVAMDEGKKQRGRYLEMLGFYNPKKKEQKLDKEKYQNWISRGAVATAAVKKIAEKN